VKKCKQYEVEVPGQEVDQRKLGREIVEKDCQACKLNREDAMRIIDCRPQHNIKNCFITT